MTSTRAIWLAGTASAIDVLTGLPSSRYWTRCPPRIVTLSEASTITPGTLLRTSTVFSDAASSPRSIS